MSKVTMPEPFGWLSDTLMNGGLAFSKTDPHTNSTFITNSTCAVYRDHQMNHYASARVREALEEAAKVCDTYFNEITEPRSNPYYDGALDAADILEQRIRALIPSTPA